MIYIIHFLSRILLLFIMSSTGAELYDYNPDDFLEANNSVTNTDSSSSLILQVLLTSSTPSNSTIKNDITSFLSSSTSKTSEKIASINSLIDQINFYRNIQIHSRIKQCHSDMKLNDICEIYSIDNNTNSLIYQSNIEFDTFEDLFNRLVNRIIVQKLNQSCLSPNSCLGNFSENDFQSTNEVIQKRGYSFCSLEQCHSRLLLFVDSCPTLSNTNISIPTLKLLPMLCTLYDEQHNWRSTECIEQIVYLLHIFYAFWPQFETCYEDISTGFDGCTSECEIFDNILNTLENQCYDNTSFLSRIPTLAWYQSTNLKEKCHQKNISTKPPFIYSVKKFFSSKKFSYQFYKKPIYISSFILIIISLGISLSLCFYLKSKYRLNSNNRRFDNNYEYTRLNNSSFDLGTNTEIPNTSSSTNGIIDDESQLDSNDHLRPSEYQRLLFVNS